MVTGKDSICLGFSVSFGIGAIQDFNEYGLVSPSSSNSFGVPSSPLAVKSLISLVTTSAEVETSRIERFAWNDWPGFAVRLSTGGAISSAWPGVGGV